MVALVLPENRDVSRWLNGVEPAWTMLDWHSFNALHDEPSASNQAIRLEPNLTSTEVSGSAVTSNALTLLRRAAETSGLKLTATGNLSRAVVGEMCGAIQAPDYDKEELLRYYKVINEPDFLPLHFIRILTQVARLCRKHRGELVLTPLGRRMVAAEQHGPLQALLFQAAFWRMTSPISTASRSIAGRRARWVLFFGRFRHRHTIGCPERRSRGFVQDPSTIFWSRHGTSGPAPWRLAFCDRWCGSGSWSAEAKRRRQTGS